MLVITSLSLELSESITAANSVAVRIYSAQIVVSRLFWTDCIPALSEMRTEHDIVARLWLSEAHPRN